MVKNYRVDSINGTAKEGEDYKKVQELVEFEENEDEKKVKWIYLIFFIYLSNDFSIIF